MPVMSCARLALVLSLSAGLAGCGGLYLKHPAAGNPAHVEQLEGLWRCMGEIADYMPVKITRLAADDAYKAVPLEAGGTEKADKALKFQAFMPRNDRTTTRFFAQTMPKESDGYALALVVIRDNTELWAYSQPEEQAFLAAVYPRTGLRNLLAKAGVATKGLVDYNVLDTTKKGDRTGLTVQITSTPAQVQAWLAQVDERLFLKHDFRCVR